jgi:hypothetical protein
MTPVTEIDQLRQQNSLLLRRLLVISRERDQLLKQLAATRSDAPAASKAAQ